MNFGDFLDNNSCGGGGSARIPADFPYTNSTTAINISPPTSTDMAAAAAAIPPPRLLPQQSLSSKPVFNSSGLSLALQTGMEGQEAGRMSDKYESSNVGGRRSRDEEHESRSGSDNMDGASGDELEAGSDRPPRKKRYHRHTPQEI